MAYGFFKVDLDNKKLKYFKLQKRLVTDFIA